MNDATAPAGADNPEPPKESRTCAYCQATKAVSPETWPYRKSREGTYQAFGARCMECEKKRKAEYEGRRDKIAEAVKRATEMAAPAKDKAAGKPAPRKERLDVTAALKAGANVLNEYAPSVLARLLEYSEDPNSPHHQWALELLATRIVPKKLFEELGGQAAGVGALADKRPMFVLNVVAANPEGHSGAVYENEAPALAVLPAAAAAPESEPDEETAEPQDSPDPFS